MGQTDDVAQPGDAALGESLAKLGGDPCRRRRVVEDDGADLDRRIYPVVAVVTVDGFHRVPDDEVAGALASALEQARGGPPTGSAPASSGQADTEGGTAR